MLIDRGRQLALDIVDTSDLSAPGWGQDVVTKALHERYELSIELS